MPARFPDSAPPPTLLHQALIALALGGLLVAGNAFAAVKFTAGGSVAMRARAGSVIEQTRGGSPFVSPGGWGGPFSALADDSPHNNLASISGSAGMDYSTGINSGFNIAAGTDGDGTTVAYFSARGTIQAGSAASSFDLSWTQILGTAGYHSLATFSGPNGVIKQYNDNSSDDTTGVLAAGKTYRYALVASYVGPGPGQGYSDLELTLPGWTGPQITTQPVSGVVPINALMQLSVLAVSRTGAVQSPAASDGPDAPLGALTYQWNRNGAALVDGGAVSGSHTATLSIANMTAARNGYYQCDVTDGADVETSRPAVIDVGATTQKPIVFAQPESAILNGVGVDFAVDAGASGPITYLWRKDGVALADGPRASGADVEGSSDLDLIIVAPTALEVGVYTCDVHDTAGTTTTLPVTLFADAVAVEPGPADHGLALSIFPNPTRQASALQFTIPVAGDASLTVRDVRGRRVAVLAAGPLAAGPHAVSWNLTDERGARVPSGVYFATVETRAGSCARRFVVLR